VEVNHMNSICINGRLTKEPIFRNLENDNAVCTLYIANDVYFGSEKKTNFIKITAWGKQGKILSELAKKGSELFITGRLDQSTYNDSNGNTVYDVGVVLEHFNFGSRPSTTRAE